ncbi:LPXTG cell wall anchor domain-containing protein [Listeria aquatica]|nr:LPXTG cell wall anchor domain-containing protein [Listeria aquatica]EUJ16869.1 hypothetical protein MAQA_14764 [Listeria aquatica FSL S10-1188]
MTYRLDDVTTGKALAKKQEAARDEAPKVTLTGSSDTAVLPPTGDDDAIPFGGLAGVGLLSLGAALLYGRKF